MGWETRHDGADLKSGIGEEGVQERKRNAVE